MPRFPTKQVGIKHGRRFPYWILGIYDYTVVRLITDAYLST